MLPQQHKLHSSGDFSHVVRRGIRIGRKTVVLHIVDTVAQNPDSSVSDQADANIARWGGPRIGLVVSKAVGNSVVRHRVSRQLRHIAYQYLRNLPATYDIVIRALPSSAHSSSEELAKDVQSALASASKKQGKSAK